MAPNPRETIHTPVAGWQDCRLAYEGTDPEDGDYYRCLVHDCLTLGYSFSCEGASYAREGEE